MSSHNEPVQPTHFDAPDASPTQATPERGSAPASGVPSWVIPALVGLGVLAVIVVFWLPGKVSTPVANPETEPTNASATANSAAGSGSPSTMPSEEASPFLDAQMAKQRKAAQDMLGELLDVQEQLQLRGIEQWAGEEYASAIEFANQGDAFYKERKFSEAIASYEQALTGLLALEASIPAALEAQTEIARNAIEASDVEEATNALTRGELIEPGNPELAALAARAGKLPELIIAMEAASTAESAGNLATAQTKLTEATTIDPQHQFAGEELARVKAAYINQQFNDAMSDGYAALDESRYDSARSAFRRADGLQPGSSEAASALQEVAAAQTASRLAALQRDGDRYEANEQWQQAVDAYKKAAEIDTNIAFAREGLRRSESRARLDKQFRTAIAEPQRLSDLAVAETMEKLLGQAQRIQPRGKVLNDQINTLERLLQLANTSIAVTLKSDMETEVIVYKVARMGRFDKREMTLRPGTYTAVGTRNGYRDVRKEFKISHDSPPGVIVIACTESI
ncbi:MAG: hypothetical protein ABJ084_05995 [Halioglobus sp.]